MKIISLILTIIVVGNFYPRKNMGTHEKQFSLVMLALFIAGALWGVSVYVAWWR